MDSLNFNSVESIPGIEVRAAFTVNSSSVFKEDVDIIPTILNDKVSYIPWGGDNQMPYNILDLVEKDETLATCQVFNAEVCYGSGLRYDTCTATAKVKTEIEDFCLDNDLAAYFLGVCQDFKHFGFAVSVLILNEDATKIVRLIRKEACYCRFAPADSKGIIPPNPLRQLAQVYLRHKGGGGHRPARPVRTMARSARQARQRKQGAEVRRALSHPHGGLHLLSDTILCRPVPWQVV